MIDVPPAVRRKALVAEVVLEGTTPAVLKLVVPQPDAARNLVDAARRVWRPAPDAGLPTGAAKAAWLADHIARRWAELDRSCSEAAVEQALACAERRRRAHDDERAVLVHGDVHAWNALRVEGGKFKLVDPDGMLAEPEYDLGVVAREDPEEYLTGDPDRWVRRLARRGGVDPAAVREWAVVERVSTGLLATAIDLQPVGRLMLRAADRIAAMPAAGHP